MRRSKRRSKSLGSADTVLSRMRQIPELVKDGKCSSALTQLIYAHEDYAALPQQERFHSGKLVGALTQLGIVTENFRTYCIRQDALHGARKRRR